MRVNKEKLLMAFDLVKSNPEIEVDTLVALVEEPMQQDAEESKEGKLNRKPKPALNAQRTWMKKDDDELLMMKSQKYSIKTMAHVLGRSESSIKSRLRILGKGKG